MVYDCPSGVSTFSSLRSAVGNRRLVPVGATGPVWSRLEFSQSTSACQLFGAEVERLLADEEVNRAVPEGVDLAGTASIEMTWTFPDMPFCPPAAAAA